jgi:hypothetical protein
MTSWLDAGRVIDVVNLKSGSNTSGATGQSTSQEMRCFGERFLWSFRVAMDYEADRAASCRTPEIALTRAFSGAGGI